MPLHILEGNVSMIIVALCQTMKVTPTTESWALTRKEAIKSLLNIVDRVEIFADGDSEF